VFKNIVFVNGKWYHLRTKICFKSCGSSPVSLRSGPDSIKGQPKGDFWWIRVAMGQGFLLVLQCSSVIIISPFFDTDIAFVYHRLWITAIESIGKWNTSPSFRGGVCRPCGNLVISPQIELIVRTVLWYSESGFRARLGEHFCKANSSVIQSVDWCLPLPAELYEDVLRS